MRSFRASARVSLSIVIVRACVLLGPSWTQELLDPSLRMFFLVT
jgi:hypothetical protein